MATKFDFELAWWHCVWNHVTCPLAAARSGARSPGTIPEGVDSFFCWERKENFLVRDPSGSYFFFVRYRCYITTNSMVFSVSQVSNLVPPHMKRIQRGKFKTIKARHEKGWQKVSWHDSVLNFEQSPRIEVTCIDIWCVMVVSKWLVSVMGWVLVITTLILSY